MRPRQAGPGGGKSDREESYLGDARQGTKAWIIQEKGKTGIIIETWGLVGVKWYWLEM